jgi:hypothetical protein
MAFQYVFEIVLRPPCPGAMIAERAPGWCGGLRGSGTIMARLLD